MSELKVIAAQKDQKKRVEDYRTALNNYLESSNVPALEEFIKHMLEPDMPIVICKQFVKDFCMGLIKLPYDPKKQVATFALQLLDPMLSFVEEATTLRQIVASCFELDESWRDAARTLAQIPLDNGSFNADFRANINVRIAQLYIEAEEEGNAEIFINRAGLLLSEVQDPLLKLKYNVCFAKMLDSKKKYLEACIKYYELSQKSFEITDVEKRQILQMNALNSGIITAILSQSGPSRTRMLSMFYKDERCQKLELYKVLEKMYLERILGQEDVKSIEPHLLRHHKATLGDGMTTMLDRAIMEHNLFAASKIYKDITFDQLGFLLRTTPEKAEKIASQAIMERRLIGCIDQIEKIIIFDSDEVLVTWDKHIENTCRNVEDVVTKIIEKYPEFAEGMN